MGRDDICTACNSANPPTVKTKKSKKTTRIGWICCDQCSKWFHSVCVRISDLQLANIQSFQYFCENCCLRGVLIPKVGTDPATSDDIETVRQTICDLTSQISKLQKDIENIQLVSKKQIDHLRSKLDDCDRLESQAAARNLLLDRLGENLELIETGAKLASTCSNTVNACRLAVNKVPYSEGENVRAIVGSVFTFLGMDRLQNNVTSCFRLKVKPSKWADRAISPTIVVVFDNKASRDAVLRRYFEKHKDANLSKLRNVPPLEYRFTINEVLSLQTFRIRNLALRLKQQNLVKSVFIRNDSVSILLPNEKKYVPIGSVEQLIRLTGSNPNNSSIFFDAVSADASASSSC